MATKLGTSCPCCNSDLIDDNPEDAGAAEQWATCPECDYSIMIAELDDQERLDERASAHKTALTAQHDKGLEAQALLDKMTS